MTTSSPAFRPTGISWRCICSRPALPPAVNAAILLVLSALVFVRIGYVYPSRTPDAARPDARCSARSGRLMLLAIIWLLPDVAAPCC